MNKISISTIVIWFFLGVSLYLLPCIGVDAPKILLVKPPDIPESKRVLDCIAPSDYRFETQKDALLCLYRNILSLPLWKERSENQRTWHYTAVKNSYTIVQELAYQTQDAPEEFLFYQTRMSLHGLDGGEIGHFRDKLCDHAIESFERGCRIYYCVSEEAYQLNTKESLSHSERKVRKVCSPTTLNCKPEKNCHGIYGRVLEARKLEIFARNMTASIGMTNLNENTRKALEEWNVVLANYEKKIDDSITKANVNPEVLEKNLQEVMALGRFTLFAVHADYQTFQLKRLKQNPPDDKSLKHALQNTLKTYNKELKASPELKSPETIINHFDKLDRFRASVDSIAESNVQMQGGSI